MTTTLFKDKIVDFDFAYFPEPRHDGIDLWRLSKFIQNQRNKYPDYKDKEIIDETERNTTGNSTLPKAGRAWWQKLFGSE